MDLFVLTPPPLLHHPLLCPSSSQPSLQAGVLFCPEQGGDVDGEGYRDGGGDRVVQGQGFVSWRCFEKQMKGYVRGQP